MYFLVLKGNVKGVSSPNKTIFQKHTVDHRPTRLLVSGYEGDEKESVLQHFGVCSRANLMLIKTYCDILLAIWRDRGLCQ